MAVRDAAAPALSAADQSHSVHKANYDSSTPQPSDVDMRLSFYDDFNVPRRVLVLLRELRQHSRIFKAPNECPPP